MPDSRDPLLDAEELTDYVEPDRELMEVAASSWFLDSDVIGPADLYWTRGAGWVGTAGTMLRVDVDHLAAMPGNPFDPVKLVSFAALITEGVRPVWYAPTARVSTVELCDVAETQRSFRDEELYVTHGVTRPFTTDDEELDAYLMDPEGYIEENADWYDGGAAELVHDMRVAMADVVTGNLGDVGKLVAVLTDGNHRAFAAQLAHDSHVWVHVLNRDQLDPSVAALLE